MDEDIRDSLREFLADRLDWVFESGLIDKIQKIWNPDYQPQPKESRLYAPLEPGICYRRPEPPWSVGLTPTFQKSIKGVDKALQGRILEALVALCGGPITAKGDTIKPLEGDMAGLWRYRIGDYRLVYRPDTMEKQIILLSFSSRESAY